MASADVEKGVEVGAPAKGGEADSSLHGREFDHKHNYNLAIRNLTYKIPGPKAKDGSRSPDKVLLNSVTATARAGEMLAVVGPSGAGKSTFLDAIAGRINPLSLEGGILVNGKPMDASFKRLSGYVMQDDQLFPMLSVRETLMFSARLRLPGSVSSAEKVRRVDMLIKELGLESAADTIIGNEEVRGVSGGEKRRVSIGVDLVHDPPVLFLDEPTSGLDSTSALNVVQILHNIATDRQRTIILTIHQPGFRILELIHRFLILARGNTIYDGSYENLRHHFKEFGRAVPDDVNVLEYALDVIEEYQDKPEGLTPLAEFHAAKSEGGPKLGQLQSNMSVLSGKPKFASSFLSEVAVLSDRNLKNVLRTKELFGARIGLMVMVGLVLGSLFFDVKLTQQGVQQRNSFFAFTLALLFFTSTEALPIFLQERQIFIRETSRGAYRTSSYVISNALVFLPFFLILSLIFSCVSYFMVGLASDAGNFFFFVLNLLLVLAVANSFVIFWSALVPSFITGNTIVTAITAFFFLFSGFFIPRDDIKGYWIWLHYLSNFKYPIENLVWNEYHSSKLRNKCFGYLADGSCNTSQMVLDNLSSGGVRKWINVFILVCFFLAYRFFFYVALRFQSRQTRN